MLQKIHGAVCHHQATMRYIGGCTAGMLLELPPQKVECLLHDNDALQAAVTRARIEYLSEHHPETLPSQEQLAQEVYEEALQMYPAEAGHITGRIVGGKLDHDHAC